MLSTLNSKKIALVFIAFLFVFGNSFPALAITSGESTLPRISYWPGKVNQHTENGVWKTDPDGVSGSTTSWTTANILTYCKKWYPDTISVEADGTISTIDWKAAGNTGSYTSTRPVYKCVQPTAVPDLLFTGFGTNGPDANNNNTVFLVPSIQNIGTAPFNGDLTINVDIIKNNILITNESFVRNFNLDINVGNFTTYRTNYSFIDPGTYTIKLTLQNVAGERNTTNNTTSKDVVVANQVVCVDSDGKDYYKQGYVEAYENSQDNSKDKHYDYCGMTGDETGKLIEYVCGADNYAAKHLYSCPNGCSNGACNPAPAAKPDLVVTSLSGSVIDIEDSGGKETKGIKIAYCVKNQGSSDINHNNFLVSFYNKTLNKLVDESQYGGGTSLVGNEYCGATIYPLYGESVELFGFQEGDNIIEVTVDSKNQIAESNETNNTLTKIVTVTSNTDTNCQVTLEGITYQLSPCEINASMTDGAGDKEFSFKIDQVSETRSYGFGVYGYGEGFPTYGIITTPSSGGALGDVSFRSVLKDQYLNSESGQTNKYAGYLPIKVYYGSAGTGVEKTLKLMVNVDVSPSSTLDLTPRISYWPGKVNQHTENGIWKTDPDGVSGSYTSWTAANILTYCKKWYPNTTSVVSDGTISTIDWKAAGNLGSYSSTRPVYKCVAGVTAKPVISNFGITYNNSTRMLTVNADFDQPVTEYIYFDNQNRVTYYNATKDRSSINIDLIGAGSAGDHSVALEACSTTNNCTKTASLKYTVPSSNTLQPGDVFMDKNHPDNTFYLATDNKRYVFPSISGSNYKQDVMNSWQVDPLKIKTVDSTQSDSYAIGGNIILRPGSGLIKTPEIATIYGVGSRGKLHKVSYEQLTKLYGSDWDSRLSIVPSVFFVNYLFGNDLNNNYPDGTLIKYNSTPNKVYLVYGDYKHPITEVGLWANDLNQIPVVIAPEDVIYSTGQIIDGHYSCLTDVAQLSTCSFKTVNQTLSLSKYTAYGNQNFVKPTTQAKVASFIITAGSSEGVNIDTINISQATSGVMQNMKLMTGATQIGVTKVTLVSSNSAENVFLAPNLKLAAGESKVVDVYADIKASSVATSFALVVDLTGTTALSSNIVTASDVTMQTMTLSAGSITSATDGSQPISGIVIAGTTAKMNAVKFTASNEAFTITKVRIAEGTASNIDSIGKVILEYKDKAGNTNTKEAYLNGDNVVDITGLNMYVPKDDSAVLTIKAEIPTIAAGADSGDTPGLDFSSVGFSALGESSNVARTAGMSEVIANDMVVRKSVPTFSTQSLPSTILQNGTGKTLYKFSVIADNAGSIAWQKISFNLETEGNVSLTNYQLYSNGTNLEAVVNNTNNTSTIEFNLPVAEVVAAGSIKNYELRATVANATSSTMVNLTSLGDGGSGTMAPDSVADITEHSNFIWSDMSKVPASTSLTDNVWVNGYLVKTFGDSAVLSDSNYVPSTYSWYASEWSVCTKDLQTRTVECRDQSGAKVDNSYCKEEMPADGLTCTLTDVSDNEISKRLAGRLLLAVEDRGRIYYIYPDDHKKYEVTFGNVMSLFQDLALGISNSDLNKILINPNAVSADKDSDGDGYNDKSEAAYGYNPYLASDPAHRGNDKVQVDTALSNRLIGKLLLQVEDHGRIWYVDQEGKRWEVTWENVMNLFTSLSLGITNADLAKIPSGN